MIRVLNMEILGDDIGVAPTTDNLFEPPSDESLGRYAIGRIVIKLKY